MKRVYFLGKGLSEIPPKISGRSTNILAEHHFSVLFPGPQKSEDFRPRLTFRC